MPATYISSPKTLGKPQKQGPGPELIKGRNVEPSVSLSPQDLIRMCVCVCVCVCVRERENEKEREREGGRLVCETIERQGGEAEIKMEI